MSLPQSIPIYLVNLDRRPDRLAHMTGQLDAMGLTFERVPALDGAEPDCPIDPRVAQSNHVLPMGRGSQAYASTLLRLFETIATGDNELVLLLQDDIELSPDLAKLCSDTSWIREEIGLVQLEKCVERRGEKLLGPSSSIPACPERKLYPLYSRTGGAACFIIRRRVAQLLIQQIKNLRYPADHLLFSPNISPYFDQLGVGMVVPSLAIQQVEAHGSDLDPWRRPMTSGEKLRRGASELNRAPRQIADMILRGARWINVSFSK